MKKIKAFLIDDEPLAIESLCILLKKLSTDIEIIGVAASVSESLTLLKELEPDVVFLDVELKDGTGFDILNQLSIINFEVIFTTGFSHYAISAIKFSAIDYLLKPIDFEDLRQSIERLNAKIELKDKGKVDVQILLDLLKQPKNQSNRIVIASTKGYDVVLVSDILYCEAENDYTLINLKNEQIIISSYNIGEYEPILSKYDFFRIHHSFLVNRSSIKRYLKEDGGLVELHNGKQLPVSRRKKNEFIDWLKNNLE